MSSEATNPFEIPGNQLVAFIVTVVIVLVCTALICRFVYAGIWVVRHANVMIVERFGKYRTTLKPGCHWLWPLIDTPRKIKWRYVRGFFRLQVPTYLYRRISTFLPFASMPNSGADLLNRLERVTLNTPIFQLNFSLCSVPSSRLCAITSPLPPTSSSLALSSPPPGRGGGAPKACQLYPYTALCEKEMKTTALMISHPHSLLSLASELSPLSWISSYFCYIL